ALEGEALATQKHWDAAATAFRAGFDMSDGTKAAVGYYGLQLKKGDPAAAGKFADRWLADHPKDATFLRVVAQSSLARKDYAAAEARFRKLLALDPNNVAALNNLAWALTQGGKPGAVPFAEKANELQPNVPAMMETLALAL